MKDTLIARAEATIEASKAEVWDALVNPDTIEKYMFGAHVVTDWREGGPITWKGEWKGKSYEDKGIVLHVLPQRMLEYTHYSPLGGLPDRPENYHRVTIELGGNGTGKTTRVQLAQDGNPTEEAREHSEKNWQAMLDGMKKLLEKHA